MRYSGKQRQLGSRALALVTGLMAVFSGNRGFGQEIAAVTPRPADLSAAADLVRPAPRSRSASTPPSAARVARVERQRGALSTPSLGVLEKPGVESLGGESSVSRVGPAGKGPRRRRRATPPWVGVQSLTPPHIETQELFKTGSPAVEELVPWFVAERRGIEYATPPPYVNFQPLPLFHVEPPKPTRYARAFQTVVRRKFYSELRRRAKHTWRDVYANRPRMSYGEFEKGLLAISRLGREPSSHDPFSQDYYTNELKEDLFSRSYREGESEVPLVAWGPLVVTDAGSLRVDVARVKNIRKLLSEPNDVKLETGETPGEPFLATEEFRVHTNVRLHFDPLEPVEEGDPTLAIKRYGVAVTVDWLSDVLGKELLSAEIEAEVEPDGDFGVAINFLIRGGN